MVDTENYLGIWLIIACSILLFTNLGYLPVNIMEARNFVTAREMVEFGNWFSPTMNGELRLAKPPLPTWLTAIAGHSFGWSTAILRTPASISALLLVYFFYLFCRKILKNGSEASIASLVLVTSFYVLFLGRTGTWDIFCHSFMMGAIYFLYTGLSRSSVGLLLISSLFCGLSFLSKGPVSFYALLLPFLIAAIATKSEILTPSELREQPRNNHRWKQLLLWLSVTIIICSLWPLHSWLNFPDKAVEISKTETLSWLNRHTRPLWHYWTFPIQSGIWTLSFVTALGYGYIWRRSNHKKSYKLTFWWVVLAVVLLSLIPEKKERYLIPVLIPGALLISHYLLIVIEQWKGKDHHKLDRWINRINGVFPLLPAILLPLAVTFIIDQPPVIWYITYLLLSLILFIAGVHALWKKIFTSWLISVTAILCLNILLLLPMAPQIMERNPAYRPVESLQDDPLFNDVPLFTAMEDPRMEMVWYAGKRVTVVEEISAVSEELFGWVSYEKPVPTDELEIIHSTHYDNNLVPAGEKGYKQEFSWNVALMERK